MIHLADYIKQEEDKGNYTGLVFLDLQKAFETLDHKILLLKLEDIGQEKQLTYDWLAFYLIGRQQCMEIWDLHPAADAGNRGVTQGSILGSLLFLIRVNDMLSAVSWKLLHAADSALLVAGKAIL